MGSTGRPLVTNLKQLKTEFPNLVTTRGPIYDIQGMGRFRQHTDSFGTEVLEEDYEGHWHAINFEKLVKNIYNVHGRG